MSGGPGRFSPAWVPSPPIQPRVLQGRIRLPLSGRTGGTGCARLCEEGSEGSARRRSSPRSRVVQTPRLILAREYAYGAQTRQ
jgi:hypothetical protein